MVLGRDTPREGKRQQNLRGVAWKGGEKGGAGVMQGGAVSGHTSGRLGLGMGRMEQGRTRQGGWT